MNVLVVSDFGVIKDAFRSILKIQPYVKDVKLVNSAEMRGHSLRRQNIVYSFGARKMLDNTLDLIIYDLDSAYGCPERQMRIMEEVSIISLNKHSASKILVVASEAVLIKLQGKVSFLHEYLIVKPFRFKDVINKVNDIRLSISH